MTDSTHSSVSAHIVRPTLERARNGQAYVRFHVGKSSFALFLPAIAAFLTDKTMVFDYEEGTFPTPSGTKTFRKVTQVWSIDSGLGPEGRSGNYFPPTVV